MSIVVAVISSTIAQRFHAHAVAISTTVAAAVRLAITWRLLPLLPMVLPLLPRLP